MSFVPDEIPAYIVPNHPIALGVPFDLKTFQGTLILTHTDYKDVVKTIVDLSNHFISNGVANYNMLFNLENISDFKLEELETFLETINSLVKTNLPNVDVKYQLGDKTGVPRKSWDNVRKEILIGVLAKGFEFSSSSRETLLANFISVSRDLENHQKNRSVIEGMIAGGLTVDNCVRELDQAIQERDDLRVWVCNAITHGINLEKKVFEHSTVHHEHRASQPKWQSQQQLG